MQVKWTTAALQALEAEGDYIAEDNPRAAARVMSRLRKYSTGLKGNPFMGRTGRVEGTRELIVSDLPYILPYRIKGEEIQILTVFHTSRNWPNKFE